MCAFFADIVIETSIVPLKLKELELKLVFINAFSIQSYSVVKLDLSSQAKETKENTQFVKLTNLVLCKEKDDFSCP